MATYRKIFEIATHKEADSAGLGLDPELLSEGGLDLAAREGARILLQASLEREVTEFLGRTRYERAEDSGSGYRNGHRSRRLCCGSGSFEVRIPKVKGAGVHERVRFGSREKEGILVAHAILVDGSRELLALELGPRESEDSWGALLESLVSRGMNTPEPVISDGAPGLIKAAKQVFPKAARQRCTAHKTRNVLNRVPRKRQARVKRELGPVFHAPSLEAAIKGVSRFLGKFGDEFPTACEFLAKDIEDCLTFYRFPEAHWKWIRTSNVIERTFKEVRRRTKVVGRFPNEKSALTLVCASIEHDRLEWRGVRMDEGMISAAVKAGSYLRKNPILVKAAMDFLAAA